MHEEHEIIVSILYKVAGGEAISGQQQAVLEEWLNASPGNQQFLNEMTDPESMRREIIEMLQNTDSVAIWKKVRDGIRSENGKLVRIFRIGYSAAMIFLLIVFTTVFFLFMHSPRTPGSARPVRGVALPSRGGVTLFLHDGTAVPLNNSSSGLVATQGQTKIHLEDGVLVYENPGLNAAVMYNSISTGPGGLLKSLTLDDGSKIWLDAMSSIRFPTGFAQGGRTLELSGQAYIEVAKNPAKPFRVVLKDTKTVVEALGTRFNLNAYDREKMTAGLFEGALKIISGEEKRVNLLNAGERATFGSTGVSTIERLDSKNETIAWKEGMFCFQKENLQNIMAEVSRWYNVDVEFQESIPDLFVVTPLSRDVPLSRLLSLFEATNVVRFDRSNGGKKIFVRRYKR